MRKRIILERNQIQKEVKAYLKSAKKDLKCRKQSKETLYEALETSAEEFFGINTEATIDDLHQFWGSPAEIVKNFVEGLDVREVKSAQRLAKVLLIGSIAFTALVLLVLVYIYMYYENNTTIVMYTGGQI